MNNYPPPTSLHERPNVLGVLGQLGPRDSLGVREFVGKQS